LVKREIEADQPRRYAQVSGDFNPIHLDKEFAQKAGLKGPILHGLCTLGIISQEVCKLLGNSNLLRKLKCRFSHPVFPGDQLSLSGEIQEFTFKEESDDFCIKVSVQCQNQEGVDVITKSQFVFGPPPKADLPSFQQISYAQGPFPLETTLIQPEKIRQYLHALGTKHETPSETAPAHFCVVFSLKPFLKWFLADSCADGLSPKLEKRDSKQKPLTKIIHASQEFEFFQPLKPGQEIKTLGGIERTAIKKGQQFVYFSAQSTDNQNHPVIFGRSLAILG